MRFPRFCFLAIEGEVASVILETSSRDVGLSHFLEMAF